MAQQLAQGQLSPQFTYFTYMFGYGPVWVYVAIRNQDHDHGRGNAFGNGADGENRIAGDVAAGSIFQLSSFQADGGTAVVNGELGPWHQIFLCQGG